MITYRGFVKTNDHATRHMLSPSITVEASRGSEKRLQEVFSRFADLMRRHVPHDGARAWFEVSDRHGRLVAEYDGATTEWRTGKDGYSKVPAGGAWTLARVDAELRRAAPREVRAR